jgi:pyruvate ferredoxin oxidoreductase gamma subunit
MLEIRFHGRGGQGAVVASELLAQAVFLDGKVAQSFPFFGVERRGAPVTAFTRIDDRPILLRSFIESPDVVVVLDPGLLRETPVTGGLRPGGVLLVNSPKAPGAFSLPLGGRVATVDATRIALDRKVGSATMPVVNTAMLGALSRVTGAFSEASLERAIVAFVPSHPEENRVAARDGAARVQTREVPPSPGATPLATDTPPIPLPEGPVASLPSHRLHTASWRTLRPVIDRDRCTRCNFCWEFCPDDAFDFDAEGYPLVKLPYCKGCGICATECPPDAIQMVTEA